MEYTSTETDLLKNLDLLESNIEQLISKYKFSEISKTQKIIKQDLFPNLNIEGIEFQVHPFKSNNALEELKSILTPKGYQVYFSSFKGNQAPNTIAILRTSDQYDIIRYYSSDGANYGLFPDDLIAKFQEWDKMYGLFVAGAGSDWCMIRLEQTPTELGGFVDELIAFCPDLQPEEDEEKAKRNKWRLESGIQYHRIVYFWWD
ncbi:DUF4253 domain-containing protein [Fulvivirga sediminis]|uniref:DUF4253 domain-containing protein n=1 Tax=Fulvivirga sediminis TaxID=2803949 RepID=A0A937K027_9BACT|nr:DUF4253 domain-containing protein [Fulvivirga sediminis]MBL3657234.1 DUF4253 domain-containing protein [Fulvivirga sediminis]